MQLRTGYLFCLIGLTIASSAAAEDQAAKAFLAGDLVTTERLLADEIAGGRARPSRYLLLGRVYFMQRQWIKAREPLKQLLAQDPGNPHGVELMARTLYRMDRHAEAIPYYKRTIQESRRPDLKLEYAESLIALGSQTQALAVLKQVVKQDKAFPHAHYLLGKLRLEAGQGHWAAQQLLIAQRLGSPEADTDFLLARAFEAEGRITGALTLMGPVSGGKPGQIREQHILITPADPGRPNFWYAAVSDTALYQITSAIASRSPDVPDALHLLAARCWLTAGYPAPAANHLSSVKRQTPETALLHIDTALARNEYQQALDRIRAAAGTIPDACFQRCLRGALRAQIEDRHRQALEFLETANRIRPGQSAPLHLLVDVLHRLERHEEAENARALLMELHPDSPSVERLHRSANSSSQR